MHNSLAYSLALGGWAARGLAHIGVAQYFEEQDIHIEELAGTSMWAIIAACMAVGMTSQEMKKSVSEIQFLKLIDLNLFDGVISWALVSKKFEELFGNQNIENTKIPLSIMATDMESWEARIIRTGRIVDALRASISLPGVFAPYQWEGHTYLDGWLKSNLPIPALRGNNIIAISVIRELGRKIETHKKILDFQIKRWFFAYNYDIFRKSISLLMATNEDLQIALAKEQGKNIQVFPLNTNGYEYYDFLKYTAIIELGYQEMHRLFK